jgi:hypothetical protein
VCAAHRAAVRIDAPRGDRSVVAAGRRYLLRLRLPRPAAVTVEGGSELASTGRDAGLPGWWMDDAGFLYMRPPARPPAIEPIGVRVTLGDRHL